MILQCYECVWCNPMFWSTNRTMTSEAMLLGDSLTLLIIHLCWCWPLCKQRLVCGEWGLTITRGIHYSLFNVQMSRVCWCLKTSIQLVGPSVDCSWRPRPRVKEAVASLFCALVSKSVAKLGWRVDDLGRRAHMATDRNKTLFTIWWLYILGPFGQ